MEGGEAGTAIHLKDIQQPIPRQKAIKMLWDKDGGTEKTAFMKEHRYILDRKNKKLYIVGVSRDDMTEPEKDNVKHKDIRDTLFNDDDAKKEVVGGYVTVDFDYRNPEDFSRLRFSGIATSIPSDTEEEFDALFNEVDSNGDEQLKIYILGEWAGRAAQ